MATMIQNLDYSTIDAVITYVTVLLPILGTVFLFIAFGCMREQLQEMCRDFKQLSLVLPLKESGVSAAKLVRSKFKFMAPWVVTGLVLYSIGSYESYIALMPPGPLLWLYTTSSLGLYVGGFLNPIILGGFLLCFFMVNLLASSYQALCAKIDKSEKKMQRGTKLLRDCEAHVVPLAKPIPVCVVEDPKEEPQLKELVAIGLQLCCFTNNLNATMSPFFLIIFAMSASAGTTLIYGETEIFFGTFRLHKLFFSLSFAPLALVYFQILYQLCSAGQRLEDWMEQSRKALANEVRRRCDEVDRQTHYDWTVLDGRLGKSGPISPGSYFVVNHSGFLCTMSTILTYLIVLLGFKIGN
jgi:hypothetical protein